LTSLWQILYQHTIVDMFFSEYTSHQVLIVKPFMKVSGTFTCLKWSLVPPDFIECCLLKIFMKIVKILIKSTTCKQWSTGRLDKYWKPCMLSQSSLTKQYCCEKSILTKPINDGYISVKLNVTIDVWLILKIILCL
jgi:hypothetical protein